MNVLQSLLCGKLNPLEKTPQTEEFRETAKRLSQLSQELENTLSPDHAALLQAYLIERSKEACMVQEYLLAYGVRLGMALQKELQESACLLDGK